MGRLRHPGNQQHHASARPHLRQRGIAQVLFFEADEECDISYADKKGKYQKQQSIVLPKL